MLSVVLNSLPKCLMKDIKEVIKAAVAAGATVVNDARVTNVSFYPAAENKNVAYWATLTINDALPGMIADKRDEKGNIISYKKGLTKTVTVPLGTVVTCLFDALIEMDNDDAIDLCDYKKLILADAEREALADDAHPYISHMHKLVNAAKLNVVARDVKKGKVKSLFSLNDKEVDVERDSVWHDIYGLTSVRESKIAEALKYALSANEKNGADDTAADAKADAFNKIMELYKQNSNAAAVSAALE